MLNTKPLSYDHIEDMNPIANAFPAACGEVSEQNNKMALSPRIEDSPQLAAESFNSSSVKENLFFTVHYDFESVAGMRKEWDDFIESIGGEIFLTYDWCRIWWKYYGRGRELKIFIFRSSDKICAVLPLYLEKIWIGPLSINVVRMVATDYMPVTCTVPIADDFIEDVVGVLTRELRKKWKWDILYIGAICGRYRSLEKLSAAFERSLGQTHHCEIKAQDIQTYFTVASDWEKQIASLAAKQRTNVRRTFRETDSKGITVASALAKADSLLQMMTAFVEMHQKHWRKIGKPGHFGAWPSSYEFHQEIAGIQLGLNRLRLLEIKFGDDPVGYEYLYKLGDTYCWFLNARTDFEDNPRIDYKWIAFRAKIQCALADGVKSIDGMRGMYDYKLLMGGKTFPINNLFIYPANFLAALRVKLFRLFASALDIYYYKIWRARLAPRFGFSRTTFWEKWVRVHPLAF